MTRMAGALADNRDRRRILIGTQIGALTLGLVATGLAFAQARIAAGARHESLSDDELKQAPSYAADKDFDWGDRSQEETLHDYYRARPYWGM